MTTPTNTQPTVVPYVGLIPQHSAIREELLQSVGRVLDQGSFVLGPEVSSFEDDFAAYCGTDFAVGVGNGTDALFLALKALGIGSGDEVITAPNSFLASASAIAMAGAKPVFVDVQDDYNIDPNLIEAAITPRTRAILPVHLTGRPADMNAILAVSRKYGLGVVEDAAQAVGAKLDGQSVGSFGNTGCFSFHPLKNLSACGDGGIITTNDPDIHAQLLKIRNHGLRNRDECELWSPNSRLDAVHAAMLSTKMKYLDGWTDARRRNAMFYQEHLSGLVKVPRDAANEYAVYPAFVIECDNRDELQNYLALEGIETKIHYATPIHLQDSARSLGYKLGDFPVTENQSERILSLPTYPEMETQQLEWVVNAIESFYAKEGDS